MAAAGGYNYQQLTADGRVVIKPIGAFWNSQDSEFLVLSGSDLGGGTLSIEVSPVDGAVVGTDAQWAKIDGLEDLAIDRAYRGYKFLKNATVAVNLNGATAPTVEFYWST